VAGLTQITDLEAKKKALAAESEVYRQMIGLELRNLQIYGQRVRRKFDVLGVVQPLLALVRPERAESRRRQPKWFRIAKTALAGWQLYRRLVPFVRDEIFGHRRKADEASKHAADI